MNTLKDSFDMRAALAFTLEQDARQGTPLDTRSMQHYERLCANIHQLGTAWMPPPPVPLTPDWCRLCGSAEREKAPGHLMCTTCEFHATPTDAAAFVTYLTPESED